MQKKEKTLAKKPTTCKPCDTASSPAKTGMSACSEKAEFQARSSVGSHAPSAATCTSAAAVCSAASTKTAADEVKNEAVVAPADATPVSPTTQQDKSNAGASKAYTKDGKHCSVTFRLPGIAAPDAKTVCVVGDFNSWGMYANPMKQQKNGDYTTTIKLDAGRQYQYRFLIDERRWENDWNADKYVKSPIANTDNSVVVV